MVFRVVCSVFPSRAALESVESLLGRLFIVGKTLGNLRFIAISRVGEYVMKPLKNKIYEGIGMKTFVFLLIVVISGCATLESTSSAPQDRNKAVSESRCAKSFQRMNNYVKYFPPSSRLALDYISYQDGKVGVRGYDLLGDIYFNGCDGANLRPNKGVAAYWYLNAANAHVAEAQYKLGKMMYEGDGVTKDEAAGMDWLMSAALEKNGDAIAYLSRLGISVPYSSGPNTYERIQAELRRQHKQQNAAYWSGFFSDLLGVALLAGATYLAIEASAPTYYTPRPTSSSQNQFQVYRYKPVWCNSSFTARASGNVVRGTITTFCT